MSGSIVFSAIDSERAGALSRADREERGRPAMHASETRSTGSSVRTRVNGAMSIFLRPFCPAYDCLSWRLVIILTGSLVVLLGLTSGFALTLHRRHLYSILEQNAVDMGGIILSSTKSFMVENDQRHIDQVIRNIGSRSSVLNLRLVNAQGEVRYSNRPSERGTHSDLKSPACRSCHAAGVPKAPKNIREGLQIYRLPSGKKALGLVVPVLNAPDCSDASCHVHPPGRKVLGIMDLELSTASLETALGDARRQMAVLALLTVLVIPSSLGLLAWRVVHRPIHAVLDDVRRLGDGDLSHRIGAVSTGELGELASSINEMSAQLEHAREELEDWNERLEIKVEEKTRELEKTRDQMVFTEKMASLGKLAAIVAHEINNPLAGILVYVKLVRRRLPKLLATIATDPPDGFGKLDETLATVETETARCGDIVRNLLLFSRRRETAQGPADINEILRRATKLIRHQADLNAVTMELDLSPGLPQIVCDAAEIEQALLSPLINALEAMPEGGTLTLRTRETAGPEAIVVEISDTGPGIPPELKDHVFEPFFSTKTEGNGTGLGLAVMYGIIQRHYGRIEMDSRPGEGTTLRVRLPLEPPVDEADETVSAPVPNHQGRQS